MNNNYNDEEIENEESLGEETFNEEPEEESEGFDPLQDELFEEDENEPNNELSNNYANNYRPQNNMNGGMRNNLQSAKKKKKANNNKLKNKNINNGKVYNSKENLANGKKNLAKKTPKSLPKNSKKTPKPKTTGLKKKAGAAAKQGAKSLTASLKAMPLKVKLIILGSVAGLFFLVLIIIFILTIISGDASASNNNWYGDNLISITIDGKYDGDEGEITIKGDTIKGLEVDLIDNVVDCKVSSDFFISANPLDRVVGTFLAGGVTVDVDDDEDEVDDDEEEVDDDEVQISLEMEKVEDEENKIIFTGTLNGEEVYSTGTLEDGKISAKGYWGENASKYANISIVSGELIWPTPSSSYITSDFGPRKPPCEGASAWHPGIDIGASSGSDMLSAGDGTVIVSHYNGAGGNVILIDHGGLYTFYAHCLSYSVLVSVGDHVNGGQKIAEVGSTGISTGAHLHFEVRTTSNYESVVDPMLYFNEEEVTYKAGLKD